MTTQTLSATDRNAAFLLSEASGARSRDTDILISGQDLGSGTVVARITANTKLSQFDQDNTIAGTNAPVGILFNAVDASGDDTNAVFIARDAEVSASHLVWPADITEGETATAVAALAALGIIVRS